MRKALKLRLAWLLVGLFAGYLLTAYVILPRIDRWRTQDHPDLLDGVRLTHTANGIPGDPLNISLVGQEDDVTRAMRAAGWVPANPLGFRSDLRIGVDGVLDRPDKHAPLSDLFLFGRKEDFAFEKPVGHSPRERHHVRFWRTGKTDQGQPVWIGAATHDVVSS